MAVETDLIDGGVHVASLSTDTTLRVREDRGFKETTEPMEVRYFPCQRRRLADGEREDEVY